jgi:predicted molibdopterin-dependent oxidoreductase YjgC
LPLGESKSDWEIISLLSAKLGAPMAYQNSQDIFIDIAATIPSFSGMTYEGITDQGMVLK